MPLPTAPQRPSADASHREQPSPLTDQERFDAEVAGNERKLLKLLPAVGILAALVLSTTALVIASGKPNATTMPMPVAALPPSSGRPAAPIPPTVNPGPTISLFAAGSNKKGPDGKMHDSFSQTNFAVRVGQPTHLRIDNRDSGPHSITAPGTGVNIIVRPGIHTYTMVAKAAGRFEWVCAIPCDSATAGWAMTHPGYMAGYITAT